MDRLAPLIIMGETQLIGEIESPRPLRATDARLVVTGWCLLTGIATPPPVRLTVAAKHWPYSSRLQRPDVANLLPGEPAGSAAGFTLEANLPVGVHKGRFEAQLPDGTWRLLRELSIAVEAPPFAAVLDTPIRTGVLRDRVKVAGWALDPIQPVAELSLRYGHRTISCVPHQPRADVPGLFPAVPHAGDAGFSSEDYLVAGHGPVRVRARLRDGRVAIATTPVTFSVATDENHEPGLDLTANRIGLDRSPRHVATPPPPSAQPVNVLFLLPGSFASNSALHVAALANELVAAGHRCQVAVSHDASTLAQLDAPAFSGLTLAEAMDGTVFPDGRGPDIVHVWTTRENVRLAAGRILHAHKARLVVHLEDNELQILALSLGRPIDELAAMSDLELDGLVSADQAHPRRSRDFLAAADGITVILDRLRDFVPSGKPCLPLMPAADDRWFHPRPVPVAFRAALQLPVGSTVLFYPGNVHASNAAEVRELYLAVLALNRAGTPVTLIRTGFDRVDFLGALATEVAPHVINLGLIPHHHHLPALMALADIFVQPGSPDPFNDYRFPSKLPEFFALGRPVILPRTNLGLSLRHGTDAYVLERADATSLAAAVQALQADPALADRLAQGAVAYAATHFSWRRSATALASFYTGLTAS